ncbi:MAG: ketopantoate reductase family protein [Mucinivorans sp.]
MNVVIVGLGAIGSVYASAIFDAGIRMRVAVDDVRRERYKKEPFFFNDSRYDFEYFTPHDGDCAATLIILATKATTYADALELIEPVVGSQSLILPLLNGLTSEQIAAQKYGWSRVLRGYYIGHTARCTSRKAYQDGSYRTPIGGTAEQLKVVSEIFDLAGIHYEVPQDIISSQWQKFIVNIGTNPPTAIFNVGYASLRANPNMMAYSTALMREAASLAVALGVNGANEMVDNALKLIGTMNGEDRSSMLQDVDAHRPTEIDIFAGEVCRLGESLGVATPLHIQMVQTWKF